MRPIQKWAVGYINPETDQPILEKYNPHRTAKPDLEDNLGSYCCYCEVFNSTAQVEHIISQDQDIKKENIHLWENFILACSKCNGRDNKTNKPVDLNKMYFPHKNNTFMAFNYGEGGFVTVNPKLSDTQKIKAQALMDLVCLDKFPIEPQNSNCLNPKYPTFDGRNDRRWRHRRDVWERAVNYLAKYEDGIVDADGVAKIADHCGYFSVWFTVFAAYKEVKKALINCFEGTALDCFDENYNPIPRNPTNINDPL
jgi:hypothetical protein